MGVALALLKATNVMHAGAQVTHGHVGADLAVWKSY